MNSELPLVSVIIPTYNRADVLPRAIWSVLSQTYSNFELIVVDDGSEDRTEKVVEYFDSDKIKYIRQKNRGANAARNCGIKKSTGKYISFLDSDDEFHEEHLEQVVRSLANAGSDCIGAYTSYQRLHNGEIVNIFTATNQRVTFEHLQKENIIGGFSAVTFRSTVFKSIGYLDEELQCAQDYDFYLRSLNEGGFMTGIDRILVKQHTDGTRISSDINRKKAGLKQIAEKHGEILTRSRLADHYYMLGFIHARDGNLKTARREFWKAIQTYPYKFFYYYHFIFAFGNVRAFEYSTAIKKRIKLSIKSNKK